MPITDYSKYMSQLVSRAISKLSRHSADTYAAKEVIPFGAAVQLNANGTGITTLKAGGTPIGVALARDIHDYTTNADDQKYLVDQPVAVVKRGNIFVIAGGDVTNGAAVKVDPATGKFVATGETAIAFSSAVFRSHATENSLVQIEINLP